jgi:hypothetical protein
MLIPKERSLLGLEGSDEFSLGVSFSCGGGDSEMSDPFSTLGILLNESWFGIDNLSSWFGVTLGLNSVWVSNDSLVNLFVEILASFDTGGLEAFVPLGELSLEFLSVFLLERFHVVGNVVSEDSCSVCLGIEFSINLFSSGRFTSLVLDLSNLSSGVTWESLGLMWYVKSTIASTLKDTEESGTGGGSLETNIEKSLEWSLIIIDIIINVEVFTVNIRGSFVKIAETDLFQQSSGEKESSGVSGGVVGKTSGETVLLELGGESRAKNSISSHGGEDNLSDEFSVSSSDDESVFLGVILVLVLLHQSSSGVVVSLCLSSSLWFDLHSLGVCLVLDDFNETHFYVF